MRRAPPQHDVRPAAIDLVADVPVSEEAEIETHDNIENAQWGALKGTMVRDSVMKAYREVTVWRRNIFYLPTGQAGQSFIEELTKILNQFTTDSSFTYDDDDYISAPIAEAFA